MSYCGILEIIDLGTSYETGEELHLLSVKLSMLLSFSLSDGYLENYPMPSCDVGLLMLTLPCILPQCFLEGAMIIPS